jgi:pimeloyl-ACP methyl ester carboxylesterase
MQQSYSNGIRVLWLALLVCSFSGCSIVHRGVWPTPDLTEPDPSLVRKEHSLKFCSFDLAKAEIAYAAAIEAMDKGDPACVDEFFCAAQFAWRDIAQLASKKRNLNLRSTEIYRSSLNSLVSEGQRHKRLNPCDGLRVRTDDGWSTVPINFHGFSRTPDDFNELVVVGGYTTNQLNKVYRQVGLGVPVVAIRKREASEPFQRKQQVFAATLLLRQEEGGIASQTASVVLELYDPIRTSTVEIGTRNISLANDTSAPIARTLTTTRRNYVQSFLQPGLVTPDSEGLFMLEPYQPGKIPIVFIHGLLSDRLTWANFVNEIHARPEFTEHYQLWGFEYPTGESFLRSATLLRSQLKQIRSYLDPQESDRALEEIVLIGHSMGGLISKMQITESGTRLWDALSSRRFEDVAMETTTRQQFMKSAFFTPSPLVSRVVFIGTPHRGSALAQRILGRVGSILIEEPADLKNAHNKLVRDNPDTFSSEFNRRVPTSIDMLDPNSDLLSAINNLPIRPGVQIHSIIGHGRWMPGNGDSDGVVPVTSAYLHGADSEALVIEKHAKLTVNPTVIAEVLAILRVHQARFAATSEFPGEARLNR